MSSEEAIRRLTDIGRTIAAQGKTSEEAGKDFIALEMAIDALQEQKEAEDEADFWKRRSKEYGDISCELIKKQIAGAKVSSVEITEKGITFKYELPESQTGRGTE